MQACHFTVAVGAPFFNVSLLRAQGNFSGHHIGRKNTHWIQELENSPGTSLIMFSWTTLSRPWHLTSKFREISHQLYNPFIKLKREINPSATLRLKVFLVRDKN